MRLVINGESMTVTPSNRGYARASLKKALGLKATGTVKPNKEGKSK